MHSTGILSQLYKPISAEKAARLLNAKWRIVDDRLFKRYALPTHTAAAEFALRVARKADEMNHHPEIHIKYRFVSFSLRTNDANMLSETDEKLAYIIDQLKVPKI